MLVRGVDQDRSAFTHSFLYTFTRMSFMLRYAQNNLSAHHGWSHRQAAGLHLSLHRRNCDPQSGLAEPPGSCD